MAGGRSHGKSGTPISLFTNGCRIAARQVVEIGGGRLVTAGEIRNAGPARAHSKKDLAMDIGPFPLAVKNPHTEPRVEAQVCTLVLVRLVRIAMDSQSQRG